MTKLDKGGYRYVMTQTRTSIIAIDGPAASGKGTLSRKLADHLNFAHMDTGALYRAVGLIGRTQNLDLTKPENGIAAAQQFVDQFTTDLLSDPRLREDATGQAASKIASIPEVRALLLQLQRDFAANPPQPFIGAVLDGRDIGTVICPDAPAKLFITASDEVRAQRRTKELQLSDQTVTYERVLHDMRERDARDAERKAAPMQAASDAFILDTSDLDIDAAFDTALAYVTKQLG